MRVLGAETTHGDSRSGWCLTRRRPYTIDTDDGTVTFAELNEKRVGLDCPSCRFAGCGCSCHQEKAS